MKTLYLVRHAKSSWDVPGTSDFERTLNKRGEHDAPLVAEKLRDKNIKPDLVVSSPAVRALTTANIFAKRLDYNKEVETDDRIYEATTRGLASVVTDFPDVNDIAMLFGHNPGIANFANLLSDKFIPEVPTCTVIGLELKISSWKNLNRECGKLILYEYPKK
jgi:phosphohistidine phosphatase